MAGFTKFPNDLLERLYTIGLTGVQLAIVLIVGRKTLGFHRADAPVSNDYIAKITGHHRTTIVRERKALKLCKILTRTNAGRGVEVGRWQINERIEEWVSPNTSSRFTTSEFTTSSSTSSKEAHRYQQGGSPLPAEPLPNKERSNKEIPKERGRKQRVHPLPQDFIVTDAMKLWAREKYPTVVDLEGATEEFRDYYLRHGKVFLDWTAAWRSWIRKVPEFARSATPKKDPGRDIGLPLPDYQPPAPEIDPSETEALIADLEARISELETRPKLSAIESGELASAKHRLQHQQRLLHQNHNQGENNEPQLQVSELPA